MSAPERRPSPAALLALRLLASLLVLIFWCGSSLLAVLLYAYEDMGGPQPLHTAVLITALLLVAALSVLLLVRSWRPASIRS